MPKMSKMKMKEERGFELIQPGVFLHEVSPVDVAVKKISVTVNTRSNAPGKIRSLFEKKQKLEDPEFSRSPISLLEDVSADMPRGTLTAIIGASGSGKTTL